MLPDIRVHLVLLTSVRIRRIHPPYTGHLSRTCVHWMSGKQPQSICNSPFPVFLSVSKQPGKFKLGLFFILHDDPVKTEAACCLDVYGCIVQKNRFFR